MGKTSGNRDHRSEVLRLTLAQLNQQIAKTNTALTACPMHPTEISIQTVDLQEAQRETFMEYLHRRGRRRKRRKGEQRLSQNAPSGRLLENPTISKALWENGAQGGIELFITS